MATKKELDLALADAVESGSHEEAKELMSLGAAPDAKDFFGDPLVHMAIEAEDFEMLSLLLASGANTNALDRFGDAALCAAIDKESYQSLEILLKAGADPNASDRFGDPVLCKAAQAGDLEMVKAIARAKANPNLTDRFGESALSLALGSGHQPICLELINHAAGVAVDGKDRFGDSLLAKAIDLGLPSIVEALLARGANPLALDRFGEKNIKKAELAGGAVWRAFQSGLAKDKSRVEESTRKLSDADNINAPKALIIGSPSDLIGQRVARARMELAKATQEAAHAKAKAGAAIEQQEQKKSSAPRKA
jgi:ankyrin repeat protein